MKDNSERVETTARWLVDKCEKLGVPVTADNRVSEEVAGELIGYAPGSLKNLRTLGGAPAYYRRAAAGGRISYRIDDLAKWLEEGREDY